MQTLLVLVIHLLAKRVVFRSLQLVLQLIVALLQQAYFLVFHLQILCELLEFLLKFVDFCLVELVLSP